MHDSEDRERPEAPPIGAWMVAWVRPVGPGVKASPPEPMHLCPTCAAGWNKGGLMGIPDTQDATCCRCGAVRWRDTPKEG